MKKTRGFSLIEVVFALFLLSLIVVTLIPALSQVGQVSQRLNQRDELRLEAKNLMEYCLAGGQSPEFDLVGAKVSPYSEHLELVEIYEKNTDKVILYCLRQK